MTQQIANINQEINTLSTNPEAQSLITSITALEAVEKNYTSFLASRIDWGDALERVQLHVVQGISLNELTQSGRALIIDGAASGYRAVASYARVLDQDRMFTVLGVPSINDAIFQIIIRVAPGGGA
jgi:Tfp pilus assembly protein PilN